MNHWVFIGLPEGVVQQANEKMKKPHLTQPSPYYWENPQWIAVVDRTLKEGMAVRFKSDTPFVKVVHGKSAGDEHDIYVELHSGRCLLPGGSSVEYAYEIGLFRGLDRVDSVTDTFVAAIDLIATLRKGETQPVRIRSFALKDTSEPLRMEVASSSQDRPILSKQSVSLSSGRLILARKRLADLQQRFSPTDVWVVPHEISVALGKESFSRPFAVGAEADAVLCDLYEKRESAWERAAKDHNSTELIAALDACIASAEDYRREFVLIPFQGGHAFFPENCSMSLRGRIDYLYILQERVNSILDAFEREPDWDVFPELKDPEALLQSDFARRWFRVVEGEAKDLLERKISVEYPRLRHDDAIPASRRADPFIVASMACLCGISYVTTGKKEYARKCIEALNHVSENHQQFGISGPEVLTLSARVGDLLIGYESVKPLLTLGEHSRLLRYFFWLRDTLETHPNVTGHNHDLMECHGLAWLARRFSYLPGSRRMLDRAAVIYREQMQFVLEDGAWCEVAPRYHQACVRELINIAEAIRPVFANAYGPHHGRSLAQMLDWLMCVSTPDGWVPAFEDSPHSFIRPALFIIGALRYNSSRYLAQAAKVVDRITDPAGELTSLARRDRHQRDLMGLAMLRMPHRLEPGKREMVRSTSFHPSGKAVVQSQHDGGYHCLMLDYGPHGGGHGHYDKLSFELYADGTPLVVDAGHGNYESRLQAHYFKQTVAHNTVMADGRSQDACRGWLEAFHELRGGSCMDIRAETYPGIEHVRRIIHLKNRFYLVSDFLVSRQIHDYACLFHFDGKLRRIRSGFHINGHRETGLVLMPLVPCDRLLERGHDDLADIPRDYLALTRSSWEGDAFFHVMLMPYSGAMPRTVVARSAVNAHDPMVFSIGAMDVFFRSLRKKPSAKGRIRRLGMSVETDAACGLEAGRSYSLAIGLTRFAFDGRIEIHSEKEIEALELDFGRAFLVVKSASAQEVAISVSQEAGITLQLPPDVERSGDYIKLAPGLAVFGLAVRS